MTNYFCRNVTESLIYKIKMQTVNIGWEGMVIGMLLMLIPFGYLWIIKSRLFKPILWATGRMCLQLLLMAVYFHYLFEWNNLWINLLWGMAMVWVATSTFISRTGLRKKVILLPVLTAFAVSAFAIGFYFLVFVLKMNNPFDARYFIPIMGLLLGNILTVSVVALSTYYKGLQREQQLYYYLLGNGATHFEATRSFLCEAIEKSFSPCIANMAVLGIVSMPGTMIGQILGGSQPEIAIKYQIMIVVITVVSSLLSVIITIKLASWRFFDRYQILQSHFTCKDGKYNEMDMF